MHLNDQEPRHGTARVFLISILAFLLSGVANSQNGLFYGTAICILRTENQIVVATDSREVNERNEPQKPVTKIIDLGGIFAVRSGMNRYGGTRFDAFVLIHRLSGVHTTAEAIDWSERLIREPLRNALWDMRKNAPDILKQYAASPLSVVFLGFEGGTPVLVQIKLRSAGEVEKHRCPGDCPSDFFAFFVGSAESKRQFEEKYPHPGDKVLVEASRWFVQMEID